MLIRCQWDILGDLARHEGNPDLSLECSWRLDDWYAERDNVSQTINSLPPVSTPRRRVFEALTQLIKSSIANGGQEAANKDTFVKICTNGTELALRKWFTLPEKVGPSHIPVLHTFQQFVELNEAGSVFQVLSNTTQSNYEARMSEVKAVLMAWRERLPNEWDDINIWHSASPFAAACSTDSRRSSGTSQHRHGRLSWLP
jgi:transformation/transcription domain-associated protein